MRKLRGIPVSPGIVKGQAFVFHSEEVFSFPFSSIPDDRVPVEIARFEDALTLTRAEILGIRKKIYAQIGRDHSDIFNAHLLILEDRTLIEDVIAIIKEKKTNAENAFATVIQRYFKAFSQIDDEYLKERVSDIRDVGKRLLRNLSGVPKIEIGDIREKVIMIAHDFSPSETATMSKEKVLGFITEIGGPTSHTAILSRSMEIPAVVGLEGIRDAVKTGDTIILDGTHGYVIVDPDENTIEEYTREELRMTQIITELEKFRHLPAETLDGRRIVLAANIEFHDELPSVISHGAEGIGLYRTEYFYLNRSDLPSEEEQYQVYKGVAEKMSPNPVIIRTLDLGGDKFLSSLDLPREMNPFLGWRAIRFCLTRVDIFKVQLRAILRASAHGKLKIMYPMIANVQEVRKANEILLECSQELQREGLSFDPDIEVGVMIEIPSAALTSDILAQEADFFSLGTNDLIQYSLAVDRVNEKLAYLYEPTHPGILKLIKQVVENAHRLKRWVGSCGEMSGDPAIAVLLVGMEIDEISTSPLMLPKVKKVIRSIRFKDAQAIAERVMGFQTGGEVMDYLTLKLKEIAEDLIE
ncbi:MAG: phosphoenolpyruvate--protein phosphotransferase [Candidatus Omnitrophica bacterium]|nr:phosphoenolpyruvate--protein phosphotransferase [Candidatus Omnitrophota bacterium]